VRIKPFIPIELTRASASIETPRGVLASEWRRSERALELIVTIPGNTSGEVYVPAGLGDDVTLAGHSGPQLLRREDDYAIFAAGTGKHIFEVRHRD
jgi:alpha-L-rhamnosidase